MKRLASGSLLLLLLTSGCQHGAPAEHAPVVVEAPPVTVTVAPLTLRPVQRRIHAVGTLQGLETIEISAKVTGRVDKVPVEVGDRVSPGQLLLEIDPTDYRLAVNEAQSALERDLAKLGLDKLPDESFDIETLPAIIRGRLLVENAKRKYQRQKTLVDRAVAVVEDYEQAETNLRVEQVTLQQTQLEIRSTLAAIRYVQTMLATAQRKLDETRLVAPPCHLPEMANQETMKYVIARRMVSAGEVIGPGSAPLLELVVDDFLELHANLPERYAGEVKLGQIVEVRVEAFPREVFEAQVSRISPTVDSVSRTFEIKALLPNSDHRLQQGVFAKASILTRDQEEAVTAPSEAVTTFAGVTKVFQVDQGQTHDVPVSIGVRGEGWVELIGDLNVDLPVVTSGQTKLAEQTKVEVRQSLANAEKVGQP